MNSYAQIELLSCPSYPLTKITSGWSYAVRDFLSHLLMLSSPCRGRMNSPPLSLVECQDLWCYTHTKWVFITFWGEQSRCPSWSKESLSEQGKEAELGILLWLSSEAGMRVLTRTKWGNAQILCDGRERGVIGFESSQQSKIKVESDTEIFHLPCWKQHLCNHPASLHIQLITRSISFSSKYLSSVCLVLLPSFRPLSLPGLLLWLPNKSSYFHLVLLKPILHKGESSFSFSLLLIEMFKLIQK